MSLNQVNSIVKASMQMLSGNNTIDLATDDVQTSIKALSDSIPDAEYYCFQQCGHLPFIEYPEKVTNIVLDFISKANTQIEIKH